MKNFRFTIKNKIYGGFILMILIFIANGIFSYYNVQKNNTIVENASEILTKGVDAIGKSERDSDRISSRTGLMP